LAPLILEETLTNGDNMTISGKQDTSYFVSYQNKLLGYIAYRPDTKNATFRPRDHEAYFKYVEALIADRVFPGTPKEEDYLLYIIDMYEGADSYAAQMSVS